VNHGFDTNANLHDNVGINRRKVKKAKKDLTDKKEKKKEQEN